MDAVEKVGNARFNHTRRLLELESRTDTISEINLSENLDGNDSETIVTNADCVE